MQSSVQPKPGAVTLASAIMDGIAALGRLRGDPRTAVLKVVALTALTMKGDRERLLADGFDGYLEKPIRYMTFLASVAALLADEQ